MWYWANDEMMAWTSCPRRRATASSLCIGDSSSNVGIGPKIWKEDGEPYYPNSRLTQITPDGEVVKQYVQGCTGSPQNYNAFSHELRIDPSVPALPRSRPRQVRARARASRARARARARARGARRPSRARARARACLVVGVARGRSPRELCA